MNNISTPDSKQSEAYAATAALFHIFSNNPKEEKVNLRLPSAWRDLWMEFAEAKKTHLDTQDRLVVKDLRDLVRERKNQELEDGVILTNAFRGRGGTKNLSDSGENGSQDRSKQHTANVDVYKKIWSDKSSTQKYQAMLVGSAHIISHIPSCLHIQRNLECNSQCGTSERRYWVLSTATKLLSCAVRQDGEFQLDTIKKSKLTTV